uniref:Evolutionarily conserved signaling intermediate in Toll pathway, mitochondrial n=1 Tax=Penaeus japonicus TaxID=27405 RepID=C8KHX2_PENJP|nr:evolutionarily conserved signaling intermediate in Toll pathways [Penaeus japonicus]
MMLKEEFTLWKVATKSCMQQYYCRSLFLQRKRLPFSVQIHNTLSAIERYHILLSDMFPGRNVRTKLVFPCKDTSARMTNPKRHLLQHARSLKKKSKHLRGHVEFIYAALRHVEEFGVQKDLETYKELLDLMPKGKMIPQNIFQAEFMHYPKQQQCAIDVLEQMETNGVMPDTEMEMILMNSFGKYSHPVRKYGRMMYWMPKFKNASPWSLPDVVSNDAFDLAKMAVTRMCTVDSTSKITTYDTKDVEDAVDDTWIISGQSVIQQELLEKLPHGDPIKVEGPFRIFLRDKSVGYFILRAEARPPPVPQKKEDKDDVGSIKFWFTGEFEEEVEETTVAAPQSIHEQEDGVISCHMCNRYIKPRSSLLSWIRLLEATNPNISNLPVLFTQG